MLNFNKISQRALSLKTPERDITDYKVFYKTYLCDIKARNEILNQLYQFGLRFQKMKFVSALVVNPERSSLETEIAFFLEKYFSKDILSLYNKRIPDPKPKRELDSDKPFWQHFIVGISNTLETVNEKYQQELVYKKNFLIYLHNCIHDFGLHADILKRNELVAKRYNICLQHNFKSKKIVSEHKLFIDLILLNAEYLKPFHEKLPVKINGKLIPFKSIYSFKVTSTFLQDDEIELFAAKFGIVWTGSEDNKGQFMAFCKDETDTVSKNPYLLANNTIFRNNGSNYVNPIRIEELRKIKVGNFDLIKLIQLCEEMNSVTQSRNYFSASLLLRSIIDHIPPYFNCANFSEVANNYSGGTKSFRKAMKNLDTSSRNIADNNIHSQIRAKEILPTSNQIDYTQELDLLLSEVIRIAK